MAALDFPSSPTDGQVYTANGKTWVYQAATSSWVATNVDYATAVLNAANAAATAAYQLALRAAWLRL